MTSTFLVSIDHGDDTDLLSLADEIKDYIDDIFDVTSVKPWAVHKPLGSPPSLPTIQQP